MTQPIYDISFMTISEDEETLDRITQAKEILEEADPLEYTVSRVYTEEDPFGIHIMIDAQLETSEGTFIANGIEIESIAESLMEIFQSPVEGLRDIMVQYLDTQISDIELHIGKY